jgi:peptide/nickel transport system substrate-binding protein
VRTTVAETVVAAEPGRHALIANSLIPPGNDGHRPDHPGFQPAGHPGTAGVGLGSALTLIHPGTGIAGPVASACAAAVERAGIPVRLVELEPAEHRQAQRDADHEWDIALTSLHPAWSQQNSRVFVQSLAEDYDPVQPIIERAMDAAAEPARATEAWQQAEQRLLDDGVVVPLLFRTPCAAPVVSGRVHDALTLPSLAHEVDLTTVRIR